MELTAAARKSLDSYPSTERSIICALLDSARGYRGHSAERDAAALGYLIDGKLTHEGAAKLQRMFA